MPLAILQSPGVFNISTITMQEIAPPDSHSVSWSSSTPLNYLLMPEQFAVKFL